MRTPLLPSQPLATAARRPSAGIATGGDLAVFTATLQTSGTSNATGAWVEVVGANAFTEDAHRIVVETAAHFLSGGNSSALMDIGVGASGSETVVVPSIPVGYSGGRIIDLPLYIPANTRVAMRYSGVRTSVNMAVTVSLQRFATTPQRRPSATAFAYGADTSINRGVQIVPGASNTKGAWSEITAATTAPIRSLYVGIQGNGLAVIQGSTHFVDVGVGPAGGERVIVSNLQVLTNNTETIAYTTPVRAFFPERIPTGSRLAVRTRAPTGSSSAYYIDAVLVGTEETGIV